MPRSILLTQKSDQKWHTGDFSCWAEQQASKLRLHFPAGAHSLGNAMPIVWGSFAGVRWPRALQMVTDSLT